MAKKRQIENQLISIKEELAKLASEKESTANAASVESLFKYMIEERERTNKMLRMLTEKIKDIENQLSFTEDASSYMEPVASEVENLKIKNQSNREIPLSSIDARIIDFIQRRGMACADEIKEFMNYKGRNAACARLNKLYKDGLLDRLQLGHKVYYKYDAGKTMNTLIVSPPQ